MLGKNHALVGTAVWFTGIAVLSRTNPDILNDVVFENVSGNIDSYSALTISTIVTAGAAVLPDFDEPEATAAREFGIAGKLASKGVRKAAGGHRQRTHTFLFAALVALWGYWAAGVWGGSDSLLFGIPAIFTMFVCCIWGFRLIGRAAEDRGVGSGMGKFLSWLFALGISFMSIANYWELPGTLGDIVSGASPRWWLAASMGIGVIAHLLGDLPTKAGVPVFWPFTKFRFALKIIKVGGKSENIASVFVFVWAVIAGVMAYQSVPFS